MNFSFNNTTTEIRAMMLKFVLGGLFNAVIGFFCFSFCVYVLSLGVWFSNLIATSVAILLGYVVSKFFVFKLVSVHAFWQYAALILGQYIVFTHIIQSLIYFGMEPYLSYLMVSMVAAILSYCVQKHLIFKADDNH